MNPSSACYQVILSTGVSLPIKNMEIGRTFNDSDSILKSSAIYDIALLVKELPMLLFNTPIIMMRTVKSFFA